MKAATSLFVDFHKFSKRSNYHMEFFVNLLLLTFPLMLSSLQFHLNASHKVMSLLPNIHRLFLTNLPAFCNFFIWGNRPWEQQDFSYRTKNHEFNLISTLESQLFVQVHHDFVVTNVLCIFSFAFLPGHNEQM